VTIENFPLASLIEPLAKNEVIPIHRKSNNNNSINLWYKHHQPNSCSHSSHNALPFDTINIFLDVMEIHLIPPLMYTLAIERSSFGASGWLASQFI
jgi:hypothetical protein